MLISSLLPIAAVGAAGFGGFWWNRRRKRGPSLEERFQSWIQGSDEASSDLKAWSGDLSDKEVKMLVNQLLQHCAELDMELEWLFGEEAFNEQLRSALQGTALAYLTSRMTAARAAEDAQAFRAYQAFDTKPKKHQEFASQLYTKLVDDGLLSVSTTDLLQRSSKKRTQYVVESIRQSATDKPAAFHQALKAVVCQMDDAAKRALRRQSPPQSPPQSQPQSPHQSQPQRLKPRKSEGN
jgi:hypothetical protein